MYINYETKFIKNKTVSFNKIKTNFNKSKKNYLINMFFFFFYLKFMGYHFILNSFLFLLSF